MSLVTEEEDITTTLETKPLHMQTYLKLGSAETDWGFSPPKSAVLGAVSSNHLCCWLSRCFGFFFFFFSLHPAYCLNWHNVILSVWWMRKHGKGDLRKQIETHSPSHWEEPSESLPLIPKLEWLSFLPVQAVGSWGHQPRRWARDITSSSNIPLEQSSKLFFSI